MSCRRFESLDEPLRDLWRRRPTLSRAEWGDLYGIVARVLRAQRLTWLQALPGAADEYISDYFQDKVLRFRKGDGEIAHTCALVVFFTRYLASRLRDPYHRHVQRDGGQRHADDTQATTVEAASARDVSAAFGRGDQDLEIVPHLMDLVSEGVQACLAAPWRPEVMASLARQVGDHVDIQLPEVLASARRFLEGAGEWAKLRPDLWWIQPYLRDHFCPEGGGGLALSALARRHEVPSYHHRAVKLGVTAPRGQDAALHAFRKSYLGQWLLSLDTPVDGDHRLEVAVQLKILCLVALHQQESRACG